jgi:O-antigen/teichoic acid export membrane protein
MKKLSVIHNTALSYLGQAYALVIGILIMPFYLSHLGAEAYGLIGFYAVMQAWLLLLDAGVSPSLVRQIAHHQGSSDSAAAKRIGGWLMRSFELVFLPMALLCALGVYLASDWMAAHWLQAQALDPQTIVNCVILMGVMVGLRLFATLYKSGLQGLEMHVWLNNANVVIATLRYFGGLALVTWVSQDAQVFFEFQLFVALVETLIFAAKAYRHLPAPTPLSGFNWTLVKPILPFAASVSLTAVVWIVLTQLDKVLLSKVLPLAEYGYFSLVALLTTGIMMMINPLVQTLLPRMTVQVAEGRESDMHALYLGASRFVSTFLFPLAAIIAFYAEPLLFAWSGDSQAAQWGAPILFWYALGSAILAVSAFQYHLQYAYGEMRLHIWYSVISAAISVPAMVIAVYGWGALGAAVTWFLLRLVSFALWPQVVHRRLAPGLHRPWLHDILRISLSTVLGVLLTHPLFKAIAGDSSDRLVIFAALAVCGVLTLALVAVSYKPLAQRVFLKLSRASVER